MKNAPIVGTSVPRMEGRGKVTGQARYVDDMVLPGMLYGATVRSRIPRGEIKQLHFSSEIDWSEFVIVTPADIPGKNCITLIEDDQPCLADGTVNHPEEPLLLLAHPDRHILPKAVEAISFEYDSLPAIFTIEESESRSQLIWGTNNIFKEILIEKGDVDAVWENAAHIVEGQYTTGAQEQLYIENNGVISTFDRQKGVTVWGSLQCPYYVHKALMKLFALPADQVRIVQMETGGAFGGKEEYPSMIAAHAALLARKSGKPVKIVYDRMEDMAATTKRHPSRTRLRTAVSKDGKILGGEIDFTIDGGAYKTLSPVVLSRGALHAGGAYYWPSVRIRAKAVATSAPPHGAFRGFGAPQSLFALERTSNASRKSSDFPQSKSASAIFSSPARPRPRDKPSAKKLTSASSSTTRSNFPATKRKKNNSLKKISTPPVKKALASPHFSTAQVSPVPASAFSPR